MFASVWAYVLGNRFIILIIALAAFSCFALGYSAGVKVVTRINAHELAAAREEAAKAQAEKDASDWAFAKADMEARHAAEETRLKALAEIQQKVRERKVIVQVPGKCAISSQAMKMLNDPSIVGETQ